MGRSFSYAVVYGRRPFSLSLGRNPLLSSLLNGCWRLEEGGGGEHEEEEGEELLQEEGVVNRMMRKK